ncbi:unnamed protein product, partial [marine sediment metagenome]
GFIAIDLIVSAGFRNISPVKFHWSFPANNFSETIKNNETKTINI